MEHYSQKYSLDEIEIRYDILQQQLLSWETSDGGFDHVMKLTVALFENKSGEKGQLDARIMLDVILDKRRETLNEYIERTFNLDAASLSKELVKDIFYT
jgi:hypothetical protein